MKLVKTANGKQVVKISNKEWQSIGKKAGWIKEARTHLVTYSPSMTSPNVIKEKVNVRPNLVPEGMSEKEYIEKYLSKKNKSKVLIINSIPIEEVSKKRGPSKKDMQRARGEKIRKEKEKKEREKQKEEWLIQKRKEHGLPESANRRFVELYDQMNSEPLDEEEKEVSLIELLERRKANL